MHQAFVEDIVQFTINKTMELSMTGSVLIVTPDVITRDSLGRTMWILLRSVHPDNFHLVHGNDIFIRSATSYEACRSIAVKHLIIVGDVPNNILELCVLRTAGVIDSQQWKINTFLKKEHFNET